MNSFRIGQSVVTQIDGDFIEFPDWATFSRWLAGCRFALEPKPGQPRWYVPTAQLLN